MAQVVIVSISLSGNTIRKDYYPFGMMLPASSNGIYLDKSASWYWIDDEHVTGIFLHAGPYWRAATVFETDLYYMGMRNLITETLI